MYLQFVVTIFDIINDEIAVLKNTIRIVLSGWESTVVI